MTIITIIVVAAISAMFGFAICAVVSQGTINEERGEMPNEPSFCYTTAKLKRHDLHVGVLIERYGSEPVETTEKVEREFANQLLEIVKDGIIVQEDRRCGFVNFDMSIWTKGGQDDRQENPNI